MSIKNWEVYLGVSCTTLTDGITDIIDVFVPELCPNAMGEPSAHKKESSVIDPFTETEQSNTVIEKRSIKAQFLGRDNHFIPCIHKGEQVILFRLGGGDLTWFWYPLGRLGELGIRRREHCRWFVMSQPDSIDPKKGEPAATRDVNSYFIDINTNKGMKMIHIHTSKGDSEPVGYDIRLLPESELLMIHDTLSNIMKIDSRNTIIQLINHDKSSMELNKTNINFYCAGTFKVQADTAIEVNSPKYKNTCTEQLMSGANHTRTMSSSITDKSGGKLSSESAGASSFTGSAITYKGAHTFEGPSFVVATDSGNVPVKIVYGSNSW